MSSIYYDEVGSLTRQALEDVINSLIADGFTEKQITQILNAAYDETKSHQRDDND